MANLNNSAAYGFALNVVSKVIIESINANSDGKTKAERKVSKAKDFAPIAITVKSGRNKKELSVVNYFNNDLIALSMYNMMYSKNIAFIANQMVYIIDSDVLRANWNNIMAKMKRYSDGLKVPSEMTYADINKVIALASETYPITNNLYDKYISELSKLKEGMAKKKLYKPKNRLKRAKNKHISL